MPFDVTQAPDPGVSDSPPPLPRGETGHPQRRAYAALDLGTNNCRLLIARPARGGFYVVDAFSRIVRLGEGLLETGRLSDAAQDRAVAALKACADKVRRRSVWVSRNVATEACRRASNGEAFVDRVFAETGIALDVISPEEEARLAVLGCQTLLDRRGGHALVFDIGGGSTEIILVEIEPGGRERILSWASVPWGVVSLTETEPTHFDSIDDRAAAYDRMRARVTEHLVAAREHLQPPCRTEELQLLGTSGTITTLASLHMGLAHYDRRKVDGCSVPSAALRDVGVSLSRMAHGERAALACIGDERADLIVAGCAILDAILDMFPSADVCVADRGIREGILRTLMRRDGHRL
ncbi:Ppx/GppA phosphatase family protein [Sphingosinicella soli]|uniref:Exopolyphosphatase/guanosine-5'-triphosphate, 3'-diphosphate pyrophosphatase n=1 Tax=Sphingosinicella soli TaxID=333708 RepID=A0A7W7B3F6_9SPHN|nr:Ppx/GppA phosphatase family protein [Sphingosinicella soli]MBB4633194.1 exopolyphosphatase/guanosine-5'-triphosphate,3'-diphosphate pyrophosphatase [Sphingosinicella soli]